MIQEHFDMTLVEKLSLIAQVFGQIAYNFWPVLLIGAGVVFALYKQEAARTRRTRR
jgi:uncharacterized membrane protein